MPIAPYMESLSLTLARTALFLSDWFTPIVSVLAAYYIYRYFFIKDWNYELKQAIIKGEVAKVQTAIKNKADLEDRDNDDCTPLILAVKNNQPAIVSLLLSAGAKVDSRDLKGKTSLIHAARKGYLDIVQALLSKRADANAKCYEGTTALLMAARE